MSVKTIYTCDMCKSEQEKPEQFWTVGIVANRTIGSIKNCTHYAEEKSLHVCRPCLESLGIYVQKKSDSPPPSQEPSIEDRIREIISLCQD